MCLVQLTEKTIHFFKFSQDTHHLYSPFPFDESSPHIHTTHAQIICLNTKKHMIHTQNQNKTAFLRIFTHFHTVSKLEKVIF